MIILLIQRHRGTSVTWSRICYVPLVFLKLNINSEDNNNHCQQLPWLHWFYLSSSLVRDDDPFLPKIKYPLEMASEGAGRVPETAGKVSEAFGILLYKPQCYKFYIKLYYDRGRCTNKSFSLEQFRGLKGLESSHSSLQNHVSLKYPRL